MTDKIKIIKANSLHTVESLRRWAPCCFSQPVSRMLATVLEWLTDFLTGAIMESRKAARSKAVASPPWPPPSQLLQGLHPFHDKILRLLHYVDTQLSLLWQIDILCALYAVFKCLSKWIHGYADSEMRRDYGSVYMRKLAPVWLSYQDDFLIFYDVYTMTGSFHIMFIWRYTSCW